MHFEASSSPNASQRRAHTVQKYLYSSGTGPPSYRRDHRHEAPCEKADTCINKESHSIPTFPYLDGIGFMRIMLCAALASRPKRAMAPLPTHLSEEEWHEFGRGRLRKGHGLRIEMCDTSPRPVVQVRPATLRDKGCCRLRKDQSLGTKKKEKGTLFEKLRAHRKEKIISLASCAGGRDVLVLSYAGAKRVEWRLLCQPSDFHEQATSASLPPHTFPPSVNSYFSLQDTLVL